MSGFRAVRLLSAPEVARALGISRMSIHRYMVDRRLPRPKFFCRRRGSVVWLWTREELGEAQRQFKTWVE